MAQLTNTLVICARSRHTIARSAKTLRDNRATFDGQTKAAQALVMACHQPETRSQLNLGHAVNPACAVPIHQRETMTIAKPDLIEGVAKGMAVLESFDTERQRLNATLAAQRAGITRAAARRHLLTLTHLGYLETDGGYFWLSAKVLRFSGSYFASARLPRVVQPTLNRLASQLPDAFSVAVLEGDAVVIVARSVAMGAQAWREWDSATLGAAMPRNIPVRLLAHGLHLGARLPAHATSTGRVLLAALPEAELNTWLEGRHLPRLTSHTETDNTRFAQMLDAVRTQDHCIANEAHELGVHAVAVPLRDMNGQTIAALNAVVAFDRVQRQAIEREILPTLQDAARDLRALL
jgi:IclR family transcriptional regulator, pca regulon regulatory protein